MPQGEYLCGDDELSAWTEWKMPHAFGVRAGSCRQHAIEMGLGRWMGVLPANKFRAARFA